MNSPRCPALWFVYILMPSKEKWVLVQLSSQHNCAERPVWSVFPNYLSVSCDYGKSFSFSHITTVVFIKSFLVLSNTADSQYVLSSASLPISTLPVSSGLSKKYIVKGNGPIITTCVDPFSHLLKSKSNHLTTISSSKCKNFNTHTVKTE